jgi:ADP-ribose pyrophosphatase YjhB (NUDIX family)
MNPERTPLFCRYCGSPTQIRIPEGDHLPRQVCDACNTIHYDNPRIVVGCVPEHEGRILLCKRAIDPRRGYWTVPAGFMENNETLEAGAARECLEEAEARVEIGDLLAVVSIPEAHQVHVFFRARLADGRFGVGPESLDTKLVDRDAVPWDDLAFPSTAFALRSYLADPGQDAHAVNVTTLLRRYPG